MFNLDTPLSVTNIEMHGGDLGPRSYHATLDCCVETVEVEYFAFARGVIEIAFVC
jgi:hypothetical protein